MVDLKRPRLFAARPPLERCFAGPLCCIPGQQVINFSMKPLSLHRRIHKVDPDMHARPMNALVLRGSFTMQVVHDWLAMCLPDVPPR